MSENGNNESEVQEQEDLSVLWKAVAFFVPLVGIFIYYLNKRSGLVLKAKSAITASVAGMILNVLLYWMNLHFES